MQSVILWLSRNIYRRLLDLVREVWAYLDHLLLPLLQHILESLHLLRAGCVAVNHQNLVLQSEDVTKLGLDHSVQLV